MSDSKDSGKGKEDLKDQKEEQKEEQEGDQEENQEGERQKNQKGDQEENQEGERQMQDLPPVLQVVLDYSRKYRQGSGLSALHPYHVLYGYAMLLDMKESVVRILLGDEKSLADLEEARRFFREKDLNPQWVKSGIIFFLNGALPDEAEAGSCEKAVRETAADPSDFSSYELLSRILLSDDLIFQKNLYGSDRSQAEAFELSREASESFRKTEEAEGETEKEKESDPDAASGRVEKGPGTEEPGQEEKNGPEDSSDKSVQAPFDRSEKGSGQNKTGGKGERTGESRTGREAGAKAGNKNGYSAGHEMPRSFLGLSDTYRKLRGDLFAVVKGQDDAVQEFVRGLYQGDVIQSTDKRPLPKATFLLAGPPGVGKTLLAETAAESLGLPVKTFNMSEYANPQSYEQMIGITSFYQKADEGELVKFVRENPRCVLIFDEIEKAHRNVIQIFLQILDFGEVKNVFLNKMTEFRDAIIIFTSNAGSSLYQDHYGNLSRTPKKVILDALKKEVNPNTGVPVFPEAIVSRIAAGNVILFNHLSIRTMTQMVRDRFSRAADLIREDYGYQVTYDERLPLLYLFSQGGSLDARVVSRQSDKFIRNELYELSRQAESHREMMNGISEIRFEVALDSPGTDQETKELFHNDHTMEILVVCREQDRKFIRLSPDYVVHFASDPDELKEGLEEDISFALVDLTCGLTEDGKRGVSVDDYHSVGMDAFDTLQKDGGSIPVYLFETNQMLTDTDKDTFFQRGAAGIISAVNATGESVSREIEQTAEELYMEEKGQDFARRGFVLEYNSAQIPTGSTLKIQFHELHREQAIDPDSAGGFVPDAERPKTRFDDVVGDETAKEELRYFIRYLKDPKKFLRAGGEPANGVLLYGAPGTGKTMLARAMAGESNVNFIQTTASSLLNPYLGVSEKNVRDLFRKARQHAPTIIFIDEIDSIGRKRTGSELGGSKPTENVLTALLTEMQGFQTDPKHPVFVLAATNFVADAPGGVQSDEKVELGRLDPALVRRFDRKIKLELPNEEERAEFLRRAVRAKNFHGIDENAITNVASRTTGLSLSDMNKVLDLAFRNAGRAGHLPDGNDLQNALEENNFGDKKEWSPDYYQSVAIHESGHAYLAWLSGEKPSYMTIESRGDFGGYMQHENGEKTPRLTKEQLIGKIRCALAGRAAEEVFYGKDAALNTGASSDLQQATRIALGMITDYGMMDNQLIALPFSSIASTPLAADYLKQANEILQKEMDATLQIITEGKETVQKLADKLLENNHLTGKEIAEVLGG